MALWSQDAVTGALVGGKVSETRVREAMKLAKEYFEKNGTEAETDAVVSAIRGDFLAVCPVALPQTKPMLTLADCSENSEQRLNKALNKAHPMLDDEGLAKKAEEAYPLYEKGDHVTVTYKANPQYPSAVEGTFYGVRGNMICVGKFRIRMSDMMGIEGNEAEILKFDEESTKIKRDEYVVTLRRKIAEERKAYRAEKQQHFYERELARASGVNEENGYTFYDGAWLPFADFLKAVVEQGRKNRMVAVEKEKKAAVERELDTIRAQPLTLALRSTIYPESARLNPEQALKAQADEARRQAEAEAKRKQEEEEKKQAALEAEQKAKEEAERKKAAKERALARAQEEKSGESSESSEELFAGSGINIMPIIVGVLIVLVAGGGIAVAVLKIKKNRDRDRFKKFFEGKGKLQKDFWAQAEADPENFKYVAYMFPGLKEASAALAKLTYIQASPNGELRCNRDIQFGIYPHQDGAVAFLGGLNFHYAPWREATAVLPEIPGAQYFKVSTEPEVKLDIPDISKIAADKNIQIENLGVEDVTDENGSFTRYFKYSAPSKEMAMLFLQELDIKEEGLAFLVETPEGSFGKDENGIFSA